MTKTTECIYAEWLRDEMSELRQDLKAVDVKVDRLLEFKWKMVGAAVIMTGIMTAAIQIISSLLQRGGIS
jgi:hypothetical protein